MANNHHGNSHLMNKKDSLNRVCYYLFDIIGHYPVRKYKAPNWRFNATGIFISNNFRSKLA